MDGDSQGVGAMKGNCQRKLPSTSAVKNFVFSEYITKMIFSFLQSHLMFTELCCVDPSLGRVDKASLPQQTLMELFIDGITNKEVLCGVPPKDVAQWPGVDVNEMNEVTALKWVGKRLEGSLSIQWLPVTVWEIRIVFNKLSGTLDLSALPEKKVMFSASANVFTGSVALHQLPSRMQSLSVNNNRLSGTLDLQNLPASIKSLRLNRNNFYGTVNLTCLPDGLQILFLCTTSLSGETDFSQLPQSLLDLNVSCTELSGKISASGKIQIKAHESNVNVLYL